MEEYEEIDEEEIEIEIEIGEAWVDEVYDYLNDSTRAVFDWPMFAMWSAMLIGCVGFWVLVARGIWRLL